MSNAKVESTIGARIAKANVDKSNTVDLSKLDLSDFPHNSVERLNKSLINLGTTNLSLADTKLVEKNLDQTSMLSNFLFETKIEILDLSNNDLYRLYRVPKLGNLGIRKITTNLKLSSVNTLILRHNNLFWPGLLDGDVFLNPHKDSKIIQLGIEGIKSLGEGLRWSCSQLQTLDLSDNLSFVNVKGSNIKGHHALAAVPESLAGTNISTLNLSNNYIGRIDEEALSQFTRGFKSTKIKTVILQDNELVSLEEIHGALSLGWFSSGFGGSSVSKLDLKNNDLFSLSEEGVTAFSLGFRDTVITELDIQHNQILGVNGDQLTRWIRTFAVGIKGTKIHTVSHGLDGLANFDESLTEALVELKSVLAGNKAIKELGNEAVQRLVL